MKKEETRGKKGVEIQENGEQLMINLNEAKLMNEENWIETTNFFLPCSFVSAFFPLRLSLAFPIRQSFFLFYKFLHQFLQILPHFCYFC